MGSTYGSKRDGIHCAGINQVRCGNERETKAGIRVAEGGLDRALPTMDGGGSWDWLCRGCGAAVSCIFATIVFVELVSPCREVAVDMLVDCAQVVGMA